MSIVGTEGIAGHENAVLLDIGVDRIRPVKTRHWVKTDRLITQTESISIIHHYRIEISVDDMLKEGDRRSGTHNFDRWIDFQQFLHAARMIRLRVIHDDIFDILDRRNLG